MQNLRRLRLDIGRSKRTEKGEIHREIIAYLSRPSTAGHPSFDAKRECISATLVDGLISKAWVDNSSVFVSIDSCQQCNSALTCVMVAWQTLYRAYLFEKHVHRDLSALFGIPPEGWLKFYMRGSATSRLGSSWEKIIFSLIRLGQAFQQSLFRLTGLVMVGIFCMSSTPFLRLSMEATEGKSHLPV